ncbi:hypothetical protein CUREO4125_00385 [Campylobacter ureolyticus]|uniref:hypothetical protein n=1 Tax=Campylobacter ureolyticus TaxID=827 RepID=UPI00215AD4CA|nr:hypothetical protein [Campylobacter ureolyticus]MCR8698848.1 hypothetical protein [Campylobacter ureolyticus]
MLKKIELEKIEHVFSDGQRVILNAPTLAQVKKANKKTDDFDKLVSALVDMSNGEMDEAFLNSLPMSEISKLNKIVENFIKFDEKN